MFSWLHAFEQKGQSISRIFAMQLFVMRRCNLYDTLRFLMNTTITRRWYVVGQVTSNELLAIMTVYVPVLHPKDQQPELRGLTFSSLLTSNHLSATGTCRLAKPTSGVRSDSFLPTLKPRMHGKGIYSHLVGVC